MNSENQLALAADYAITKRIGESPIYYDTITFEEVGCFTEYFLKAFVKLKENGDARMAKVKLIVNKEKLNKGKNNAAYILEHADAIIESAYYSYESRSISLNIKTPGIYDLDDDSYNMRIIDFLEYDKHNKKLLFTSK